MLDWARRRASPTASSGSTIDDPDPTFAAGTTNNQAIVAVGDQGRAKGAATFSRLEGIFYDSGKVYLVSTQGGDTARRRAAARPGTATASGSCGSMTPGGTRSRCCSSRRAATCSSCPDNLCISPRKCSLLCEDDAGRRTSCAGSRRDGKLFDFARNAIAGRQQEEFAGSTFTPDCKTLFVNIQSSRD